ncbi:Uracil DNA glycosylase superfamily protein [Pelotomaculum schinkii]|uniref:Uracil DNA glycosylase superfamily protein n=1 Tax=Pelotomaculum schinkii TaxID=78350 RepID=A0A4Y7R822_9FIRM|nr:uracil-DNA glycosylase family protein [Pelotomaculum schinkii]TEB04843.1 Uracil DNA glycosylase superfamily protein [Pelotomaculum schinkii]
MNIKKELESLPFEKSNMQFCNVDVDLEKVRAIMVNEVVPADPKQDFYGDDNAAYLETTIPLFQKAGIHVNSISDILNLGVYITNAVKVPKTEYTISKALIEESLPFLEKELSLFPDVKVIMLMGDVAKKAFNMISKKVTRKNAVPGVSTYKLRNSEIYHEGIRIMPSYIMTGQNILIEKSKFEMVAEDIFVMVKMIQQ